MKKIGIIFAMNEEIDAFKENFCVDNEYNIFDLHFFEGIKGDNHCVLVISGVGKVNAARATQILIDNYKVDYIINVGVAGGINNELHIGDIVIGEKLVQHDFDITAFNHKKGYIPNLGIYINADEYLVRIAESVLSDSNTGYFKGVIASGDIFCTEEWMSKKIADKFDALCVEMEGASIAQVCFFSKVPFLILRSISDVPNNDNVITYEKFLADSSKKIALALDHLLDKI